jgi:hypothetical protein
MGMHDTIRAVRERKQLTGSMPAALRGAVDSFRLQVDGIALRDPSNRFGIFVGDKTIRNMTTSNLNAKAGRI